MKGQLRKGGYVLNIVVTGGSLVYKLPSSNYLKINSECLRQGEILNSSWKRRK